MAAAIEAPEPSQVIAMALPKATSDLDFVTREDLCYVLDGPVPSYVTRCNLEGFERKMLQHKVQVEELLFLKG